MLNTLRNKSVWGTALKGVLATVLLAGGGVAMAAPVTVGLCATAGTSSSVTAIAPAVPVWGYTLGACAAVTAPGGPVITVNQGDVVTVNLQNSLPEATGILFQGQSMVPDTTGAAASTGTKSYTFTATNPGTFLYQAALLPNAEHQVAMGLYGALIVRPTSAVDVVIPGQAYVDPATAYGSESVLVLSEIDPLLNNSLNRAGFDMRNYAPKYFLINGKPHPNTDAILATSGGKLLLRYVNAGAKHHSMAALGLRQNFVAKDASRLPTWTHNVAAETLAPGQTGDAIIDVPAAAAVGNRFAVYDASLALHNNTANPAVGLGGMLAFVNVGAAGPSTGAVTLSPNPADGTADVIVSATVTSATTTTVAAAEFFIDVTGANGTGSVMTGVFTTPIVTASGTISVAQLAALAAGNHTVYVHGRDATGAWSTFTSATLTLNKGPAAPAVTLTPPVANSTNTTVALSATFAITSTVNAAEYFIDATGVNGGGLPMVVGVAPNWNASITLATLAVGSHTVYVHGQDATGSWGGFNVAAVLNIDAVGPTTSPLTLTNNPSSSAVTVALSATANDSLNGDSYIAAAEYTVDGGAATAMTLGGVAGPSRPVTATIAAGLAAGNHTVAVRSRDALGNWGAQVTATLTVTSSPPVTSNVLAARNPNNGAFPLSSSQPVMRITATVTGSGSTIAAADAFICTSPAVGCTFGAAGAGLSFSPFIPSDGAWGGAAEGVYIDIPLATINTLSNGNHTIYVRGRDATGVWSVIAPASSTVLLIDRTAPTFTSATLSAGTVAVGGTVTLTVTGAADTGGALLAGGQYWVDGSATPPATPTAFALTLTGVPISTSALTIGTHTVYVRVKDGANNFSTVSSATLTVIPLVVNDTRTITANGIATQNSNVAVSPSVLANDLPLGVNGARVQTAPVRLTGAGLGSIALTCAGPGAGVPATPSVGSSTICTNGLYRVVLTGVGADPAASKRGTFRFTYRYTVNGQFSVGTVDITVN